MAFTHLLDQTRGDEVPASHPAGKKRKSGSNSARILTNVWFGSRLISGASRLLRHLCGFDQRSVAPALWMVQTMTGNKDLSFPGNFPPQLELISFILVSVFSSNYFGNTA